MNFYIDSLSDEDLAQVVRGSGFQYWLEPFKRGGRKYAKYSKLLGTMKSNSLMVKQNLPGVVVKLYRAKDHDFVKHMEYVADGLANSLLDLTSEVVGKDVTAEELRNYSNAEIAEVIIKFYKSIDKKEEVKKGNLDFDLLWVQFKLNGIELGDDRKAEILRLCETDVELAHKKLMKFNPDKQQKASLDNTIVEDEIRTEKEATEDTEKPQKSKRKKLTPQEKAERNKLALEKKTKGTADAENKGEDLDNDTEEVKLEEEHYVNNEQVSAVVHRDTEDVEDLGDMDNKVYICLVQFFNNHYNFSPIGIYFNGEYHAITETEVDELLPSSEKNNINFFYGYNYENYMNSRFKDNELIVMSCGIEALEENRNSDGVLLPTGYKIRAEEGCASGKIQFLGDVGLYKLIKKEDLDDDIVTQRILRLEDGIYVEGESVLIDMGDGFYAGPYKIKYQPTNRRYVIITQENTRTGYITGYYASDCQSVTVGVAADRRYISKGNETYFRVKDDAELITKDLITDDELFSAFAEAIKGKSVSELSSADISDYIEQQKVSLLTGKTIPESIKKQRLEIIQGFFNSAHQMDEVTSKAFDVVCNLILKNKDSKQTEELVTAIVENRPDFFESIQGIRIIQSKLEAARQELAELEQKKSEIISDGGKQESEELSSEIESKKEELKKITDKIKEVGNVDALSKRVEALKDEEKYLEKHNKRLEGDSRTLEKKFVGLMEEYSEKMADITFDGYVSSKMLQAAAEWERGEEQTTLEKVVHSLDSSDVYDMDKSELIDYIVNTIKIARPGYDRNVILNILICSMQGFLTVFSGIPGCGKTSICNILGKTLGLNDYSDIDKDLKDYPRYIPVSVERGWTSKRDFVGYFNPLTKSFEESNRKVFQGLKLLNQEYLDRSASYPYLILLDEANLSPMEYYWADFMNVCDDRVVNNSINLGNNNEFHIPETLHFLATINNDHTTETLSPRLIDRAWIITLPKNDSYDGENDIPEEIIKHISWQDIKNTFVSIGTKKEFDRETSGIFEGVRDKLSKQSIRLSARVIKAIYEYWKVASEIMEADEFGNQPDTIALDYAIAQKVLPKISGNGDEFGIWLGELKDYCSGKNLDYSAGLIEEMLERGNRRLKYYDFFK